MNIKELKRVLEEYPENMEVWVLCEGYGNAFPATRADIRLSREKHGTYDSVKEVLLIGME